MDTTQATFAVDRAVEQDRKSRDRKYLLRMHNRKWRNIHPNVAFWPEVTKSRDRKSPCLEVALTGNM